MHNVETLLYIVKGNKVLLIEKKRGLGAGLYNGVGGKVEKGETPIEAAIRECKEEIGVIPKNVRWVGLLEFYNNGSLYGFVHVFLADDYEGELKETDEAKPVWFEIDKLPFDKMWGDDIYWLPLALKEIKFYAVFHFEKWEKITKKEVYILKEYQQWQT